MTPLVVFGLCLASLVAFIVTLLGVVRAKTNGRRVLLMMLAGISLLAVVAFAAPFFVKPRVVCARSACIANLKQLQGAKATWALEFKKSPTDVPMDQDLFGDSNYIRRKPQCPQGGTYRIGAVGEEATCSHGGAEHRLDD